VRNNSRVHINGVKKMSCAIVILGSPNDSNGNLLPIAISRAEAALIEYKKTNNCKFLCTGGFGESFNVTDIPHGQYLQNYLIAKGVPSSSFIEIALSSYTLEDATLSKPILAQYAITRCTLVTSDFHMERAKLVFNQILPHIAFNYVESKTLVSKEEIQKLVKHEVSAIKREQENLKAIGQSG
jgi:uncharacterized SAM-binding protein YcdF (DUF218 family)